MNLNLEKGYFDLVGQEDYVVRNLGWAQFQATHTMQSLFDVGIAKTSSAIFVIKAKS